MTDREKLIALLVQDCREERGEDDIPCCEESFCKDNHTSCYGETADYLLAHGVVVREWIPVTERLPEPFVSVLVQMPYEAPWPTVREGFVAEDGSWHAGLYHRETDEVTHWMPMPEPPMRKGENG